MLSLQRLLPATGIHHEEINMGSLNALGAYADKLRRAQLSLDRA
jgi:hypothetical protein